MLTHLRTTLELPTPLFNKARKLARQRKVPFRAIVAEALTRFLEQGSSSADWKLPDRSFAGDGLVSGLSETDWEQLRDLASEGGRPQSAGLIQSALTPGSRRSESSSPGSSAA